DRRDRKRGRDAGGAAAARRHRPHGAPHRESVRARPLSSRVVSDAELAGKVALVTGGGRGIGERIAQELPQAGLPVAVSARCREQIENVAREIAGIAVPADVSDRSSVAQLVKATESELGPIDVLVNNAGVMSRPGTVPIWEEDPADWWRVFEINVLGAYL